MQCDREPEGFIVDCIWLLLQMDAHMVPFSLLAVDFLLTKDKWKFMSMDFGGQYPEIRGTLTMLKLSADSSVFLT